MGNLLNEYRRRHDSNFIWATNDGVCFFNKNRRPAAICLISDSCRCAYPCENCALRQPRFVCEIIAPSTANTDGYSVHEPLRHDHINIDQDIMKIIEKVDPEYAPYYAKDKKDIEAWLWNFFLRTNPLIRYQKAFDLFVKTQDKKSSNTLRAIEQMVWVTSYCSNVYGIYYERFYQYFVLGRHYLLYK